MLQNRYIINEDSVNISLRFWQRFILNGMLTILYIPILQILFVPFACQFDKTELPHAILNEEVKCTDINNIINMSISFVFVSLFIGITTNFEKILFETNIFKEDDNPLIKSSGNLSLQYDLVIASLCFFHTIFQESYSDKGFILKFLIVFQLMISFFLIFKFTFYNSFNDQNIGRMWKSNTAAFFITNLFLFTAYLFEGKLLKGLQVAVIISYPITYFIAFNSYKRDYKCLLMNPQKFNTDKIIIDQFTQLKKLHREVIFNHKKNIQIIDGFLEVHSLTCNKSDCYSVIRKNQNRKTGQQMKDLTVPIEKEQHQQKILQLESIMKEILFYGVKKYPQSLNLRMLYVFYLLNDNKKQNALQQITQAERYPLDFLGEFIVYRYKKLIQEQINNQRNNSSGNQDILAEIAFQEQVQVIIEHIKKNALLYIDYWELFKEEMPNLVKIQVQGKKLTQYNSLTQKEWNKLQNIGGNMQRIVHIYGKFMLEVINNKEEGEKLIVDGIEMQQEKSKNQDNMIITENEDICKESQPTVIINSDQDNFANIIAINQASIGFFKNNKGNLINKSVNVLMPEVYSKYHNKFIKNLVQDQKWQTTKIKEKYIYSKDKYGYIQPVYLQVHPFQTLTQNLQFVGIFKTEVFFKKVGIILTDKFGTIKNITAGCIQVLNISNSFLEDSDKQSYHRNINEIIEIFEQKKQYMSKLGQFIDKSNLKLESQVHGPTNSFDYQINLCVQTISFQTVEQGKQQGFLFKFEQINDVDNTDLQQKYKQEKQKNISRLSSKNDEKTNSNNSNNNNNNNEDCTYPTYDTNQVQQLFQQMDDNMPEAIYRFSYFNENEGLIMNWVCQGQFYNNCKNNKYQLVKYKDILNSGNVDTLEAQEFVKAIADKNQVKEEFQYVNYGKGFKTVRYFKNKFEIVDLDSEESDEEDFQGSNSKSSTKDGYLAISQAKSTEVYSEFSNIQKSQKAISIVTTDTFQIEEIRILKYIFLVLLFIVAGFGIFEVIYAQISFQENMDRIDTVLLSNKKVSDLQSTLGFARDLKLLALGLYDQIFDEQEKLKNEKEWKEQIIKDVYLIRDIERDLTLSPIKPSGEQYDLLTQPNIPMYFNEDLTEEERIKVMSEYDNPTPLQLEKQSEFYNLNDATRQLLVYAHKITTVETKDLTQNDSFTYFIETNLFQDYFYEILRSSQIYTQDLQDSNNSKIVQFTIIFCIPLIFLVSSFIIQNILLQKIVKTSETVLALMLDVEDKIIFYIQNRASTFYYNLLQDKDEEVESFEKLEQPKDEQESTTLLGKKRKKKYNYKPSIYFYFRLSIFSLCLMIQLYFFINFMINTSLVTEFKSIITELNSTSVAEPFFFFAENLQRAAFIDPDTFKPFNSDPSLEIIKNLVLTYELDQKIHSDHSSNFDVQIPSYKKAFEDIMLVDACKVLYEQKALTSISECENFAAKVVQQGMAPTITRYLENIKHLNTIYDYFIDNPEVNFYKYAPEGSILIDIYKDQPLKRKCLSLLVSPPSMENRQMQKIYIKSTFDFLKKEFQNSVQSYVTSRDNQNIILIAIFISFLICIYLFLWIPFMASLNNELRQTRSLLGLIPLSVILDTVSIKQYIRRYIIKYQKRQYSF